MRIGIVTGEYPPMQGGVADFSREMARAFAAAGHEVFVYTSHAGVGLNDDGVWVSPRAGNWNFACLGAVRRWAMDKRIDVLNLQYQTAAFGMAGMIHLLPRLVDSVPVVVTFHDLRVPYLFPKAGALRKWAVLALARNAAGAIVTNREDEQELIAAGGVSKLKHIPIGSNIEGSQPIGFERAKWRARVGAADDELLIAYFGFLNSSKGVDVLLRALGDLNASGIPARLVMIGGRTGASDPTNAAYADEIDALIELLGMQDRVRWTGYVEPHEVSAYLYSSDLCALPFMDGVSFRRGSVMAALAHGCAIVTTRPSLEMPEIVDGQNMALVDVGESVDLAKCIKELAADPALRSRLGRGALELHEMFTWERIAGRTAAFLDEVLEHMAR